MCFLWHLKTIKRLWDHLGSTIHLYVEPQESHPDEDAKTITVTGDQARIHNSRHLDSDSERGKTNKLSRSRHNREWKSLVRDADEPPPFQSSVFDDVHTDDRIHRKVSSAKRSPSPQPIVQKKRSRPDERQHTKRGVPSQGTIGASRRLLQFAVRDAVALKRPSSSSSEPALKRIRSVVSTSYEDPSVEVRPRRLRSVARLPNAMVTAIKAVEEAAKDVKNRSSGNVFDRIGRGMDVSQASDQLAEYREGAVGGAEYGDFKQVPETHSSYLNGTSDNEGYDGVNVTGHRIMDASQTGISGGNDGEDSLMVQYRVAKNSEQNMRKPRKDQDQPVPVASTSRKIVNISVNVNTWKPSHYQEPGEVSEMDTRKPIQGLEAGAQKSNVWSMKENSKLATVGNGNATPAAYTRKVSQKTLPTTSGLYSTGRPTEDADSRTIFVNNVHFAATKDSLSRHFNKFGDVLKVGIVTDAATGQPKGSAYVEFMRKDAAENALSLDGTSFMSRLLKVVRKSSAHQESGPIVTWPLAVRGSPFAPSRFARIPFPRGIPSVYRGRPPIKPGARSLQWKRDAQASPSESSALAATITNIPLSPGVRSLTYVRTEPKTSASSGTA
ncbi:RNA binding (RRM/RBD/RNP motifs) family protein [Actinidia rufa]|uniref:RNA binding (RRM/RBD/RNP motifs) family protein n=1 Tax=Actinidia rufa TaxID=165716 RepID=A0A7J0FP84_9ERIC|nr:RNA binding (RRM/RBD/RNP motifs) family protein [Actinidia rufa]